MSGHLLAGKVELNWQIGIEKGNDIGQVSSVLRSWKEIDNNKLTFLILEEVSKSVGPSFIVYEWANIIFLSLSLDLAGSSLFITLCISTWMQAQVADTSLKMSYLDFQGGFCMMCLSKISLSTQCCNFFPSSSSLWPVCLWNVEETSNVDIAFIVCVLWTHLGSCFLSSAMQPACLLALTILNYGA